MEPAWIQFESAFKNKVNIVHINVDEKSSPEMKKYGQLLEKAGGGIPYTVWLGSKKQELDHQEGGMSAQQLTDRTNADIKKAH